MLERATGIEPVTSSLGSSNDRSSQVPVTSHAFICSHTCNSDRTTYVPYFSHDFRTTDPNFCPNRLSI